MFKLPVRVPEQVLVRVPEQVLGRVPEQALGQGRVLGRVLVQVLGQGRVLVQVLVQALGRALGQVQVQEQVHFQPESPEALWAYSSWKNQVLDHPIQTKEDSQEDLAKLDDKQPNRFCLRGSLRCLPS